VYEECVYIFVADNFQALIQYSDAIAAQTGKAVRYLFNEYLLCTFNVLQSRTYVSVYIFHVVVEINSSSKSDS